MTNKTMHAIELKRFDDKIEIARAFQTVFKTEAGKIVMEELEREGFWKASTFMGQADEAIFNEGKRSFLVFIKGVCSMDITALINRKDDFIRKSEKTKKEN